MKRKRNRRERERRVARSIYPLIHPNGIGPLVRLVPTAALLSVTNFIPLLDLDKFSPQTYHTFHLSHFFVHSLLSLPYPHPSRSFTLFSLSLSLSISTLNSLFSLVLISIPFHLLRHFSLSLSLLIHPIFDYLSLSLSL